LAIWPLLKLMPTKVDTGLRILLMKNSQTANYIGLCRIVRVIYGSILQLELPTHRLSPEEKAATCVDTQ
jgi:hypothetical protein